MRKLADTLFFKKVGRNKGSWFINDEHQGVHTAVRSVPGLALQIAPIAKMKGPEVWIIM